MKSLTPSFYLEDGVQIMIMDDPSMDGREVYYRIPGYPFIFAYGLPNCYSLAQCVRIARYNASTYAEDLFK